MMAERRAETSLPKKSIRKAARKVATPERSAVVTPQERRRMIAESAYYRAERRRFRDGEPDQDWLEAEAEIDQMLIAEKDEM